MRGHGDDRPYRLARWPEAVLGWPWLDLPRRHCINYYYLSVYCDIVLMYYIKNVRGLLPI